MKSRDMTQGTILSQIVLFAIPLLLSSLLQQLYNTVDVVVVGNFIGREALAAVGVSSPLILVIISFFMGLSIGASVLVSQFFGARDAQSMHNAVHTAIALSLVVGVLLAVLGIVISPTLLRWMKTPEQVLRHAVTYLRIYFAGLPALTLFNMGAAILAGTGDSKRPLYFLTVTAVINITLNLLFVIRLQMGIAGVAWSTVIAQIVSAVLIVFALRGFSWSDRLVLRDLRIRRDIFRRIVAIGLPGGVQAAIVNVSGILEQTYINGLGADAMAGFSASHKLDAFTLLPMQTLALAISIFVAQNLGARQVKRARRGAKATMLLALSVTVAVSIVVMVLGKQLLRIFSPDPVVLDYGTRFKQILVPAQFLLCFSQILPGALRGAEDVRIPTAITLISFVAVRQISLLLAARYHNTLVAIALCYPISWALGALAHWLYYRRSDWSGFRPGGGEAEHPALSAAADARR